MKVSRRVGVIAGAVAIVVAAMFAGTKLLSNEMFTVEPGGKAPGFSAVTLDASPTKRTMDDFRGKVVLLNVWATWCEPCRVEMPSIEALHKSLGPRGLKVVAVSVDEPGFEREISDFVREYGLTFEVLYDPAGKIRDQYQTTGYPETFIIGSDGLIRRKIIGATDWNSPGNRALIEHLLAERSQ